jgi:MinD superfamily P-loop ATPase
MSKPFKIAVASGKGGTGKTTVSVNLYMFLHKELNGKVHLVDCDVEEPNDIIFFNNSEKVNKKEINRLIPYINTDKCTFCKKCIDYCEFNAVVVITSAKFAEINKSLCHSCGACLIACEENAITEYPESIGTINFYNTQKFNGLTEGNLKIGSAMQTMLIKELKKNISENEKVIIYDAPPGTSCSVVETISDSDYVILVTEPTLFGLHDLKLMVSLLYKMNLRFGVVINKAGLGDDLIYKYLSGNGIDLIGEIPFSKEYASIYAKADITNEIPENIKSGYYKIVKVINEKIFQNEGNNYFKW